MKDPRRSNPVPIELSQILSSPKIVAITITANRNNTFLARQPNRVDPLMNSFDAAWIPKTVNEANLVLTARWQQAKVGDYSDGSAAYQEYCDFQLHDRQTGRVLIQGRGAGSLPRRKNRSQTAIDQFGGYADREVVAIIKTELAKISSKSLDP